MATINSCDRHREATVTNGWLAACLRLPRCSRKQKRHPAAARSIPCRSPKNWKSYRTDHRRVHKAPNSQAPRRHRQAGTGRVRQAAAAARQAAARQAAAGGWQKPSQPPSDPAWSNGSPSNQRNPGSRLNSPNRAIDHPQQEPSAVRPCRDTPAGIPFQECHQPETHSARRKLTMDRQWR